MGNTKKKTTRKKQYIIYGWVAIMFTGWVAQKKLYWMGSIIDAFWCPLYQEYLLEIIEAASYTVGMILGQWTASDARERWLQGWRETN